MGKIYTALNESDSECDDDPLLKPTSMTDDEITFSDGVVIPRLKVMNWKNTKVFEPDACVVVNGRRRTGKTTLTLGALYEVCHYWKMVYVFSETANVNVQFEVVPPNCVFEEFTDGACEKLLDVAARMHLRDKGQYMLIILDDVVHNVDFTGSPSVRKLATLGRHYGIGMWILSQYVKRVPPVVRENADLTIMLIQSGLYSNEMAIKDSLATIPTIPARKRLLAYYTQDHGALIIHSTGDSNTAKRTLFYYKAPFPPPKYKLGSKKFWDANTIKAQEKEQEADEEEVIEGEGQAVEEMEAADPDQERIRRFIYG